MFVQAVDLKFYQKPVFFGSEWIVMFADGVGSISVRDIGKPTLSRAKEILTDIPIEFHHIKPGVQNKTIVNNKLTWAQSHEFMPESPIPIPTIHGAVVDVPTQSSVMIGFVTEFETSVLVRAILGMEVDTFLCRAIMKQVYYKKQIEQIRPELAKKLYAQHPFLREFNRKTWEQELEKHPKKVLVKWRTT